jgi:hypothetical protein
VQGAVGATGTQGPGGSQGSQGIQGAPGTALGYAHITFGGTFDPAHSAGVSSSNFTHQATGTYCFSGLSFTPHNIVATIDGVQSADTPGPIAEILLPNNIGGVCPTGAQAAVITTNNGIVKDYGVYIVFN